MNIPSAIPYLSFVSERIYILLFGFIWSIYIIVGVSNWVWRYGGMAVLFVGWLVVVLYCWWKSSFSFLLGDMDASKYSRSD